MRFKMATLEGLDLVVLSLKELEEREQNMNTVIGIAQMALNNWEATREELIAVMKECAELKRELDLVKVEKRILEQVLYKTL
jgi:hypothetical protein